MVKKIYTNRKWAKGKTKPIEINERADFLIIVESPSKCSKIQGYLGDKYACIASKGHICVVEGLSAIKKNYDITFSMAEDKKDHIEWMRNIIGKFAPSKIFLATDDDREGEAIAWHICQVFGLDVETTPRIIFREITEKAVQNAVKTPQKISMGLVKAQQARQILDLLVGFKISPILWKYLYRNSQNSLSAGRCQTPALRLVYDNEQESKTKSLSKSYKVLGAFYAKKIEFHLTKEIDSDEMVRQFLEASSNFSHRVAVGEKREHIKPPPKPFSTSTLLQAASSLLHIGPKETMSICQTLYQSGHITYMRTESREYSAEFLKEASEYITKKCGGKFVGDLTKIENRNSANPHEAIRITHIGAELPADIENAREKAIYKLIWKNTVESCMPPAVYSHIDIFMTAPLDYSYIHTLKIPVFLGWRRIEKDADLVGESQSETALLLYIQSSPKENIVFESIRAEISLHGRHIHYTEATLIKRLEDMGIGRPSTFASIVDTIIDRGYVKKTDFEGIPIKAVEYVLRDGKIESEEIERTFGKERGKLGIQPLGIIVSEFLTANFKGLFEYEYTKNMEEELDKISIGNGNIIDLCGKCEDEIKGLLKPLAKIDKQSFSLADSKEYFVVYEKYGPVLRKKEVDGTLSYKKIRYDIQLDIGRLKKGDYSLDELVEPDMIQIGEYLEKPVYLKRGPYGRYILYDGENVGSLKICETWSEREILDAFIDSKKMDDPKIMRILTPDLSIRNGKYGAYIFYKRTDMLKPQFYNMNQFKDSYKFCEESKLINWIKEKYNLSL